ncbi:unnamed protein product [Bursaphelenchus xylophilus]|uniref:(pine wood nematode) hypothetical protein n=1 Tax=Bursaphelenchus xylophilus TaxID=6326 RepID=A0A1I7RY44_BURXY|nr:unnamed protein product [Bursaphelenchus xylophilus]CAG9085271.1 unnamed protein product [Bursaphelenchus xylophilus]
MFGNNRNFIVSTPVNSDHQPSDTLNFSPIGRTVSDLFAPNGSNSTRVVNEYVLIQSKLHFGFVRQGAERYQDLSITSTAQQSLWIDVKSIDNPLFNAENSEGLYLSPRQSHLIKLIYKPKRQKSFDTGTLVLSVKTDDMTKRAVQFRVTLLGFSGKAEVVPRGLQVAQNNTWEACVSKRRAQFSLQNVGNRAAFVRVIVVDEMNKPSRSSDVFIKPDQFLLDGNSSQTTVSICLHSHAQDVKLAIYWGEEKQRLRCKRYAKQKNVTSECVMDYVDLISLKINESRLSETEAQLLSSDDKRVLMSELTVTYVRLIDEMEVSTDTDVTLTNENLIPHELRVRPIKFPNAEVQTIDDDLETCIRKIK